MSWEGRVLRMLKSFGSEANKISQSSGALKSTQNFLLWNGVVRKKCASCGYWAWSRGKTGQVLCEFRGGYEASKKKGKLFGVITGSQPLQGVPESLMDFQVGSSRNQRGEILMSAAENTMKNTEACQAKWSAKAEALRNPALEGRGWLQIAMIILLFPALFFLCVFFPIWMGWATRFP